MIRALAISVVLSHEDWHGILADLEEIAAGMQTYVDRGLSKYVYRQQEYRDLIATITKQLEKTDV